MREFVTGATRDKDDDKFDYDGFLSPLVLERYAAYMHKHRQQADGKLREADNWKKGIPQEAYMKSAFRHFVEWWKAHNGAGGDIEDAICALIFNAMGYLHNRLTGKVVEPPTATEIAHALWNCPVPTPNKAELVDALKREPTTKRTQDMWDEFFARNGMGPNAVG